MQEEESRQTPGTPLLSWSELPAAWALPAEEGVLAEEDVAHREDDVAVALIEVAVSTQRHQHQLHFLERLEECAAVLPPAFPHSLPLLSLGGPRGWRSRFCRWPAQHRSGCSDSGSSPLIWAWICWGDFLCPPTSFLVLSPVLRKGPVSPQEPMEGERVGKVVLWAILTGRPALCSRLTV